MHEWMRAIRRLTRRLAGAAAIVVTAARCWRPFAGALRFPRGAHGSAALRMIRPVGAS